MVKQMKNKLDKIYKKVILSHQVDKKIKHILIIKKKLKNELFFIDL